MDRDVRQTWFGQGLAQKKISVAGQWWDTQLLDSSWISAVVQGGYLGVGLVVVLGAWTVINAAFSRRSEGSPVVGHCGVHHAWRVLGERVVRWSSVQFMVFLVTALGAFGGHVQAIGLDRRAVTASAPRFAPRLVGIR